MKLPGSAICRKARKALVKELKTIPDDLREVFKRNEDQRRESQTAKSSLGRSSSSRSA
jgi:hypothetical protein